MLLKRNKFIFNLHLILSLLACLPLFLMVFSAPFASYKDDFSRLARQNLAVLKPSDKANLSLQEILLNLREKTGFTRLNSIAFYDKNDTALRLSFTIGEQNYTYFIDPRTADIIASDWSEKLNKFALSLHRNLGFSLLFDDEATGKKIGKQIVAVSSIIMAILAVSGIWLYFPLIRKNFLSSLKFSSKAKGYGFFYKFHSSLGLWVSAGLILMSLSGLYWSYGFVKNGVNTIFGATSQTKTQKKQEAKEPTGGENFGQLEAAMNAFMKKNKENFESATMLIPNKGQIYDITLLLPNGEKSRLKLDMSAQNPSITDANDLSLARKIHRNVYALHTGQILGRAGQALFAAVCLIALGVMISGFAMTFKRINR